MPKIRGIHPGYWTDEDIVELSIPARLLFIGLWTYACDNGHLDDKPKQIRMRLFPADDVNVDKMLDELVTQGRITRESGTITIHKFAHHQKPHTRWWSTCDLPLCVPPEGAGQRGKKPSETPSQPSPHGGATVVHGGSPDDVDCDVDVDGDGESDTAETEAPKRTKARRKPKTPLPENFVPNDNNRQIARDRGLDLRAVFEKFRDYNLAVDGRYADWHRAFSNWLRNENPSGHLRAVPDDGPRLHPVTGEPYIDMSDDRR